jgi:hypothetical protein
MDDVTIRIDELVLDADASTPDVTADAVAWLPALAPLTDANAAAVGRAVADSLATALPQDT